MFRYLVGPILILTVMAGCNTRQSEFSALLDKAEQLRYQRWIFVLIIILLFVALVLLFVLKRQYTPQPEWHTQDINSYTIDMRTLKRTRIILWVMAIVLSTIYAYVYVGNPFQKEFDLGIFGLVFPLLLILAQLLLRKNKFKNEMSLLASSGLLIVFYFIFL